MGRGPGMVTIKQCYSVGEIRGRGSGGITGSHTAQSSGHVSITDCYSCGVIIGIHPAGGICGRLTGASGGTVILTNVYASGQISHQDAGGLGADGKVSITMSVFSGSADDMVGNARGNEVIKEIISGDLNEILALYTVTMELVGI